MNAFLNKSIMFRFYNELMYKTEIIILCTTQLAFASILKSSF